MNKLGRIFNHKRILGIILSLALAVGLLVPVTSVFAANAASIAVTTPGSTYVQPGASSVSVVLKVTTDDVYYGWGVDSINFDTSKLQCATTVGDINTHASAVYTGDVFNVNSKTASGPAAATVDNTSATGAVAGVAWALTGVNSLPQVTAGTVLTLTFSVKSGAALGDTTISISGPAVSTVLSAPYPAITETDLTLHIVQYLPPTIGSFLPTAAGNGEIVAITGTNFTGATAVSFGGAAATIVGTPTATTINARVGVGASGVVSVTTPGGTITASGFTYLPGTVTSLSPAPPATVSPGASLVITGTHLTNASLVTFGTSPATNVNLTSTNTTQTTVTISVPSLGSSANGITVSVTTPDGMLTNSLTINYIGASVTGFTPTTGYAGDTITITGTGFTAATGVTIGGMNVASSVINSDTSITAVVGSDATGPVGVKYGPATINSTANFNYKAVTLFVLPGSQTVNVGSTFTVTLNINTGDTLGTKQVRGWQSNVSFDPSVMQCTGIAQGTFFSNWFTNPNTHQVGGSTTPLLNGPALNNHTGKITDFGYVVNNALTPAGQNQGASGSGVLATLTFTAIKPFVVNSAITLSNVSVADQNANPIAGAQGNSGVVTVATNYPAPTPVTGSTVVDSSLLPQLTLIAPASISGWNLVVSPSNSVQRTMNVFANTQWQITVSDQSSITAGYLTEYNGSYVSPAVKLSNPLQITSDAGNGTGNGAGTGNLVTLDAGGILATGTQYGQNQSNGGDMRNVFFTQPVTYTDPTLTSGYTYHMVVTFTAINTGY